ncbi:MAG: glycolate oxidase subunit GlcF [Gammaproteobacteria bacterium]|nr:glycolate oxidase subunit GlcF [Gammaproteobacteria bacterium]
MQTKLAEDIKDTPQGREANSILRRCVHCGFCNATCPTYQLLGDELDGPRGRIYLVKQMLEGNEVTRKTQQHLDRCLTCLNCQTTCPSGVEYGALLNIGRSMMEQRVSRSLGDRLIRLALRWTLPYSKRFGALLWLGQRIRPLLPNRIRHGIPRRKQTQGSVKHPRQHPRKVLMLAGCVQPALSPSINNATEKVLDALGISIVHAPRAGCCGALSQHLGADDEALGFMQRNIDAWWPQIESGVEAIVTNASGCGMVIKHYERYLRDIPEYAEKAIKVSALAKDIAELIHAEDLRQFDNQESEKIVFHPPCTLQHGQGLGGIVESILTKIGYQLLPIQDGHLCCGSAGTYSILQAELSQQLLQDKLNKLQRPKPKLIATANIGCQLQLESKADAPVVHWIELLAQVS